MFRATHRVVDEAGTLQGFIIDGVFRNESSVRHNIKKIENLKLTISGIIRAKNKLPEVLYVDAVTKQKARELRKQYPFKRDIQRTFKNWYSTFAKHSILQLEGSRQIGKTTEILKFAYTNYSYVVYVNLATDDKFASCIKAGCNPENMQTYCRTTGLPEYHDSSKTVLVLDEIQESPFVFNCLRLLKGSLKCHIIITGSYLGRLSHLIDKNEPISYSAGTVMPVKMFSMSFAEYCGVFNGRHLLNHIHLDGTSPSADYQTLDRLYSEYLKVGGYPAAVATFAKTRDIVKVQAVLQSLIDTFSSESERYFKDNKQHLIFEQTYRHAVELMLKEKRGNDNSQITDLHTLINPSLSNGVLASKKDIEAAVTWLFACKILDSCDMMTGGDALNIQHKRRSYYTDCGLFYYIATVLAGLSYDKISGILTETFAFMELKRLYISDLGSDRIVIGYLCFSIFNDYELDFVVRQPHPNGNVTVWGLETKTTTGAYRSLDYHLDNKMLDKGIVAKCTKGGKGEKFDTIPIYAIGARFPYN